MRLFIKERAFHARGSTEFDSLEGWLGHKSRGGGGGKFFSKWKEKGSAQVWLHTQRLPLAIWRHPFPMYVVVKDKDDKDIEVKHVFSKKFVCHEDESVLTHPWRDKNTGEREHPPKRCGLCKFNDWLWMQILAWLDTHTWDNDEKEWKENKKGKGEGIDPCTKIFEFESEAKDSENVTMYAGGCCGFFGLKELPKEVSLAMKAKKIRGDEVWKQNASVKCESVMCIVNNDDIAAGVQIAVETQALGDKVKEEIQRVWKSNEINIQKQPYVIEWGYNEKEIFSKKYSATSIMKIKPSDRVLKLIRGEAPDLTELKKTFDQQKMRATLEEHCLLEDVPWDDLFPSEKQEREWAKEDAEAEEEEKKPSREPGDDEEEDEAGNDDDDDSESDDKDKDEDDEMVACDECKKPIKLSAKKCPHCGHKYEDDAEEEEEEEEKEEEKPKLKSRSEIAKEKAESKSKTEKKTEKKSEKKSDKKPSKKDDDEDDDQDSEIPF